MLCPFSSSNKQEEQTHGKDMSNSAALELGQYASLPSGGVRLGFMSTAAVSRHLLGVISSLRELPEEAEHFHNVRVVAVSSRDADKAAEFAQKHGIPTHHGSHEALLADPNVDAVYITMPNHVHVEWITRALAAGKHVLCEKPMVLTVSDALAVQLAQAEHSATFGRTLIVMEAVMSLYTPQTAVLEQVIASGVLGQLQYVRGLFQYNMSRSSFRSSPAKEGGGSLWDVGCYPIYLARHLLRRDEPVSCSGTARWSSDDKDTGYDAAFSGVLTFASGVALNISSSLHTAFGATSFEIHGTKGSAALTNAFKPAGCPEDGVTLHIVNEDGKAETKFLASSGTCTSTLECSNPYAGELRRFCELVRGANGNGDTDFSAGQVRCMEGLHEAARTGRTISLQLCQ